MSDHAVAMLAAGLYSATFVLGIALVSVLLTRGIRAAGIGDPGAVRLAAVARLALLAVAVIGGWNVALLFPIFAGLTEPILEGWLAEVGRILEFTLNGGLTALAAVYGVERSIKPFLDDRLDRNHTVEPRHRRRKWLAIGSAVFAYSLGVTTAAYLSTAGVLPLDWITASTGVLVWLTVVYYLRLPYGIVNPNGSRDPTPDERTRLERCYDQFGRPPAKTILFERSPTSIDVFEAGRGSSRFVWLRESFLRDATDDELGSALAHADARNRADFWRYLTVGVLVLFVGLGYSAHLVLIDPGTLWLESDIRAVGIFAFLGLGGASIALARRSVYRSDAFVCESFDPETVRRTYLAHPWAVRYYDVTDAPRILESVVPEPPLDRRIDRVVERHSLPDETPSTLDEREDSTAHGDPRERSDDETTAAIAALESMESRTFTRFVADLRAEWGWECDVVDDDATPADIVATNPSTGERVLICTVRPSTTETVTRATLENVDDLLEAIRTGSADSALLVTTGRFGDDIRELEDELSLVERDDLLELLDRADIEATVAE